MSRVRTLPAPGDEALRDMETVISRVLQGGVLASMAVVLVGVVRWATALHPTGGTYPSSPAGVWHGLVRGEPMAVIQAGLLLLIATPVVRVAASVLVFRRERDRAFTWITLVVLGLLVFGMLSGRGA